VRPARRYNQSVEVIQDAVDRALDRLYLMDDEGQTVLELARTKMRTTLDALKMPESR